MTNEKIINHIIDYAKYHDTNVFDAILDISEQMNLDVEDIVRSLDDNLLYSLKQYCIAENKVLINDNNKKSNDIESLFA